MSNEQKQYLKNIKKQNIKIIFTQILIFILFITLWQILANKNIINTFITSSPKQIFITIKNLYIQNNLFPHILITIKETIISFILTSILSIIISIMLYNHNFIAKVLDPYLTILNSLPKVALGPIIIIWIGANTKSIILMAILISLIVSIQTIYNGFINTDKLKIKLLKTFNASKKDIFTSSLIKLKLSFGFSTMFISYGSHSAIVLRPFTALVIPSGPIIVMGSVLPLLPMVPKSPGRPTI